MPRAGLTADRVVEAAGVMTDDVGFAQLTLAGLAAKLGVRQPSLYKHVESIESLRRSLAIRAKADLTERLTRITVGRARDDALTAMAHEYRAWAREHPGSYQAAQRSPEPDDVEDVAASQRILDVMAAVMSGYGLRGNDAIDAIRAFRATVHGFVSIELAGGFTMPRGLDRSYDLLVRSLVASLSTWKDRTAPTVRRRSPSPRH